MVLSATSLLCTSTLLAIATSQHVMQAITSPPPSPSFPTLDGWYVHKISVGIKPLLIAEDL